nr:translation initiation factor IF-2-like [Macaca fascicularis]
MPTPPDAHVHVHPHPHPQPPSSPGRASAARPRPPRGGRVPAGLGLIPAPPPNPGPQTPSRQAASVLLGRTGEGRWSLSRDPASPSPGGSDTFSRGRVPPGRGPHRARRGAARRCLSGGVWRPWLPARAFALTVPLPRSLGTWASAPAPARSRSLQCGHREGVRRRCSADPSASPARESAGRLARAGHVAWLSPPSRAPRDPRTGPLAGEARRRQGHLVRVPFREEMLQALTRLTHTTHGGSAISPLPIPLQGPTALQPKHFAALVPGASTGEGDPAPKYARALSVLQPQVPSLGLCPNVCLER